jgi:hypothetical protein
MIFQEDETRFTISPYQCKSVSIRGSKRPEFSTRGKVGVPNSQLMIKFLLNQRMLAQKDLMLNKYFNWN